MIRVVIAEDQAIATVRIASGLSRSEAHGETFGRRTRRPGSVQGDDALAHLALFERAGLIDAQEAAERFRVKGLSGDEGDGRNDGEEQRGGRQA